MSAEELQADPVQSRNPAVAAGQIGKWYRDSISSYLGMAEALESMTSDLATAQKVAE